MKYVPLLCAILICFGCASPESGKICDPPCQDWEECVDGICTPPPCCPNAPEGEYHITVSGKVFDITTMQGVDACLQVYEPLNVLDPDPRPLDPPWPPNDWYESDDDGHFDIPCFDVTTMALGCILIVDDCPPDGVEGTYFPTGSGAKGWDSNREKICAYDSKVYVVPSTLVAALDADTSVDSAGYGFVMGRVVDSSGNPVAGAVLKKSDGTDLYEVIYPDVTFTTFDGTATSVNGLFVLPHPNFATGITEIVAEKEGITFGAEKAAPKAGLCYVVILAN